MEGSGSDSEEKKRKFSFIILLSIVTLFILMIFLIVLVIYFCQDRVGNINHLDETEEIKSDHFLKLFELDSDSQISLSLLRFEEEVKFIDGEESSFTFEEDDSMFLVSKFGGNENEYQCKGTCYCENDDEVTRRTSSAKFLKKGLTYLLAASSSLIAMNKARDYFENQCVSELSEECSSSSSYVLSEVDDCEDISTISNEQDEEEEVVDGEGKKHSVLFVCFGNICRSTMCECIFRELPKKSDWMIDSCGTHVNEPDKLGRLIRIARPPDKRTMDALKRHLGDQIEYEHKARALEPEDFTKFDYILCMDDENVKNCMKLYKKLDFGDQKTAVIKKVTDYSENYDNVFDPFFSKTSAFEDCFQVCYECCTNFLKDVEG